MSNNKQQTSVEWLEERMPTVFKNLTINKHLFEQAKEMDKQQKIEFAKRCLDKALDLDVRTAYSKIEQYYNETFGGKDE
jgi:hypothetical protein